MGARSFRIHQIAIFVFVALLAERPLQAQAPVVPDPMQGGGGQQTPQQGQAPAQTQSQSVIIDPYPQNYDITVDMGQPQTVVDVPEKTEVFAPWNRQAGGLFAAITNSGAVQGAYRITDDKIMEGKSSEFGYGAGAFLDFPNPGMEGTNLRFRLGAYKVSLEHNNELKQEYGNTLESSATLFHLAGIMRFPFPMAVVGNMWFGIGGQLNYALSTKNPRT